MSNLNGRINRLEQLHGVNGGPPKIIVCWHGLGGDCDCTGRDDDIIIRVVYKDDWRPDVSNSID